MFNINEKNTEEYSYSDLNDITKCKKEKIEPDNNSIMNNKFLESVSHEVRTYINGIIGMTDLTLMTNLNSEQRENLNLVKSSALKLLDITSDVLDISRIQLKQINLEKIEFNFKELMDEINKVYKDKLLDKRSEFRININSDIQEMMVGDPLRIKQVIENLIDNSTKFAYKSLVIFEVEKDENTDKYIRLNFSITVKPMDEEKNDLHALDKQHIKIGSKNNVKSYIETGLGNIVSKELIQLMGGKIEVKSKKNNSIVLIFNLLLEKGKKYSNASSSDKKQDNFSNTKINKSLDILIVEDDKANQMIIYNIFKKNGHRCDIAENGQRALNMINNKQYDLILMDIQMPILDGIQTTKMIRKLEENGNKHIPIIALTAYALKGDKERFLDAGMDNYITKPFDVDKLLKTVYSTIKNEKASIHIINKQNNIDEGELFLYLL